MHTTFFISNCLNKFLDYTKYFQPLNNLNIFTPTEVQEKCKKVLKEMSYFK